MTSTTIHQPHVPNAQIIPFPASRIFRSLTDRANAATTTDGCDLERERQDRFDALARRLARRAQELRDRLDADQESERA